MAGKVISADLTISGIEDMIRQLKQYKEVELPFLVERFVKELAEVGIPVIDSRMNMASVSYEGDIRSGADTSHYTYVKVNTFGDYAQATLVVSGRELLFIEFGAGISLNTPVGSSPHPKGEEFGFTIGSYGKGYGSRKVWGYYADGGELVLTRGVKATMPVHNAEMEIIKSVVEVAKKVFK